MSTVLAADPFEHLDARGQAVDLADVLAVVPASLGDHSLAGRIELLEDLLRRTEAALIANLAEADRRAVWASDGHRSMRGWVMSLTNCSPADALARCRQVALHRQVEGARRAAHRGTLGIAQARELARLLANPRCGAQLVDAAEPLLHAARTLPFTDFLQVTRRWEQLADSDGAHRSAERAHQRRHATWAAVGHQFQLHAVGGAAQGELIAEVLRAFTDAEFEHDWEQCRQRYGEQASPAQCARTPQQRRFDALHALCAAAASAPGVAAGPTAGPAVPPTVSVIVDQATFEAGLAALVTGRSVAELTAHDAPTTFGRRRCETGTGTPLDPLDAAAAALIGHVRRVVFDSSGVTVDLGRRRRLFSGSSRVAALLGIHRCLWPGCGEQPRQVDHTVPFSQHGTTDQHNSGPLCGFHNRWRVRGFTPVRQPDGGWRVRRPDGSYVATGWDQDR